VAGSSSRRAPSRRTGGPADINQPFRITSGFRGSIDELALDDIALSDDRIAAHYAAGKTQ